MRHLTLKLAVLGLALTVAAGCRDGDGVVVRHLAFEGVGQVPESDLRAAMVTVPAGWLPWTGKTYFSRQDFDDDLRRLEAFYQLRGYPDARVTSFRTHYLDGRSRMDLTVVIDEGAPLIVEGVEWHGFGVLPPEHFADLQHRAALATGVPRNRERLEAVRALATDELRDHGYPAASVSVSERAGRSRRGLVLAIDAAPGAFATFGEVTISGNGRVSPAVLRRQLSFKPGEAFRRSALGVTQRRLYGLELFQFVNVEATPVAADGTVTTAITVVEAPHRQVRFGAGYGSEDHARVEGEWKHLNLFGGARGATLNAKWSSLERGVRASITDPSLAAGVAVGLSGQSWSSSTPAYALRTTGGRLGLLRAFGAVSTPGATRARDTLSVSFAREYESYTVSADALGDAELRPTLIALGLDPYTGAGSGTVMAVTADLQRNTVANLLDARRGWLGNVHAEVAGKVAGGDFAYREFTAEARAYVPAGSAIVLAGKARGGVISAGGNPDARVPFFKRYFLGGATSLRGWGRFEVAPLSADGLPIGGYTFVESSGELRWAIDDAGTVGLVGFVDAGNVWGRDGRRPSARDVLLDAGLGLRVMTPVGPLRFDVAHQITPIGGLVVKGFAPGDYRRWRFHFSIGQAF